MGTVEVGSANDTEFERFIDLPSSPPTPLLQPHLARHTHSIATAAAAAAAAKGQVFCDRNTLIVRCGEDKAAEKTDRTFSAADLSAGVTYTSFALTLCVLISVCVCVCVCVCVRVRAEHCGGWGEGEGSEGR